MADNINNIEEAAEKFATNYHFGIYSEEKDKAHIRGFVEGALSDAAQQYWFDQFKAANKKIMEN